MLKEKTVQKEQVMVCTVLCSISITLDFGNIFHDYFRILFLFHALEAPCFHSSEKELLSLTQAHSHLISNMDWKHACYMADD